jgi:cobalt-zinc-cadmium efflux system protein
MMSQDSHQHEERRENGDHHSPSHEHHKDHSHDHDHNHDHSHGHGLGHSHAPKDFNSAFAIGVVLNTGLVVAQVVAGLIAHSLALVADAGHNFADVLGLVLAWWATRLAKSPPTKERTYGMGSASILAALANAIFLLITMGAVAWEAVLRLNQPTPVQGRIVMWIAALGILINGLSAALFYSGRKGDLNVRAAFLHLAGDAGISLGVVAAGAAILLTGQLWIDPVASLVITAIIVYSTWSLLRDSMRLALQGVPRGIDIGEVRRWLEHRPGVSGVHDLHIWAMSTTETALTAHLLKPDGNLDDDMLRDISREMEDRFRIHHVTLQCERGDCKTPCPQAPDDVV